MSGLAFHCFGKLPLHGDFIHSGAAVPELDALDPWFEDGLYGAARRGAADWAGLFDSLAPTRFLFRSRNTGRVLAGAFVASRDKAGRRFPFLVFSVLEAEILRGRASVIPVFLFEFFERATELATAAWQDKDLHSFVPLVEQTRCEADLNRAESELQAYLKEERGESFWTSALGSGGDPRRYMLLQNLADAFRGGPTPRYALRFPHAPGAVEAAFWLELAARVRRVPSLPVFSLWDRGSEGRSPGLTVLYDDLQPRYLLPMLCPDRDSDQMFPLLPERQEEDARLHGARERFGAVLDDGSLHLLDFLDRLANMEKL